jgi:hypothetical protein
LQVTAWSFKLLRVKWLTKDIICKSYSQPKYMSANQMSEYSYWLKVCLPCPSKKVFITNDYLLVRLRYSII